MPQQLRTTGRVSPMTELSEAIRVDLAKAGDPERAAGQQAYMKSAMPYHGVTSPELRALLKPYLAEFRPSSREEWEQQVLDLFDHATHREQRYAALAFARHRRAAQWLDPEALPMLRHLITTGAWWDLVDESASHLVGRVLSHHRADTTPVMMQWADDDDLWIRRTSVICQLGHKSATDTDLLRFCIEANLDDASFWLRKAIGWALREYAKTDPDWVRAEVGRVGERLSPLSRREALKHLGSP